MCIYVYLKVQPFDSPFQRSEEAPFKGRNGATCCVAIYIYNLYNTYLYIHICTFVNIYIYYLLIYIIYIYILYACVFRRTSHVV